MQVLILQARHIQM